MRTAICLVMLAGQAWAQPELDPLRKPAITCDPARAHCFGIHLHVAIGEHGPVATADWVAAQLAAANHHFAPVDVGWQIVGVDALPAEAARVEDRAERDGFAGQVTGAVLHVFVTAQLDDIDHAGAVIRGVTWRGGAAAKYVILSTLAWERVLAHELGHVFGLPHSRYPISIMNKTERAKPPHEQRTFADQEIELLRAGLRRLVRAGKLGDRKGASPRFPAPPAPAP